MALSDFSTWGGNDRRPISFWGTLIYSNLALIRSSIRCYRTFSSGRHSCCCVCFVLCVICLFSCLSGLRRPRPWISCLFLYQGCSGVKTLMVQIPRIMPPPRRQPFDYSVNVLFEIMCCRFCNSSTWLCWLHDSAALFENGLLFSLTAFFRNGSGELSQHEFCLTDGEEQSRVPVAAFSSTELQSMAERAAAHVIFFLPVLPRLAWKKTIFPCGDDDGCWDPPSYQTYWQRLHTQRRGG